MKLFAPFCLLTLSLLCGCATDRVTAGHGDVGQFILQQSISYGGSPTTTNGLPAITSRWSYSKDAHGVVISMSRDDYSSAESFLSLAFAGQHHFGPEDGEEGFRIFEYRLTPNGGGIQLSRNHDDTKVVILRPFGPAKQSDSR